MLSTLLKAMQLTLLAASAPSGLRVSYFNNAMLLPRNETALARCSRIDALSALAPLDSASLPSGCGGHSGSLFAARWDGTFAKGALHPGTIYDVALRANVPVRLWVRTWKLIDEWTNGGAGATPAQEPLLLESPWNFTAAADLDYSVRLEALVGAAGDDGAAAPLPSVQLLWRQHGVNVSYVPVPDVVMLPIVRASEMKRQALQRKLARGWNTWHRASAAAHVHLPTGFGLSLSLRRGDGGDTPAATPAPAPPPPAQCGAALYLNDTGCFGNGISGSKPVASVGECCALCQAKPRCAVAVWNGPVGQGKHYDSTCNLKFSGSCKSPITGQTFMRVRPEPPSPPPAPTPPTPAPASTLIWTAVDHCHDAQGQPSTSEADCKVRPGAHAYDGSYTTITQRVIGGALNFTISSAHLEGGGDDELLLLVRANDTAAAAAARWHLAAEGSFGFFDCPMHSLCGTVDSPSANGTTLVAHPAGFDDVTVRAVPPPSTISSSSLRATAAIAAKAAGGQELVLSFDGSGLACLVVGGSAAAAAAVTDTAHCAVLMDAAAARHEAAMEADYPSATSGANRHVADALRAVVGWNVMWDPRVKVIAPVSRDMGVQPYAIWLWDTFFLSLLAGESSMDLAFSNVIEVTRPTVYGDVPGIRTANEVALDRSKPYVGALVVREHYRRWGKAWLVDLLFDDLLIWTNWIRDRRTLPVGGSSNGSGGGLIVLGSDNLTGVHVQSGGACSKQHAVWESGLDNSPMYDGVPITRAGANQPCLLPLHDAGMTGLYLAQCDALADLADVVNRTADAAELRGRVAAMTKTLNERLWHEDIGVYSNRYSGDNASGSGGGSGLFLDHISPFNFHPMMSGAATEEQARRMVTTWLTAEQGFCLPPQQPLQQQQQQQQQPACKFGLPSIARSDKAFTDQNYWRGRTWGPMNFLVYQGLAHPRYANVSEVQYAKAALANASRALLLKEWTDKHHVCENYNAMTGTGGDVSHCNPFYTWGALLGENALVEDGALPAVTE